MHDDMIWYDYDDDDDEDDDNIDGDNDDDDDEDDAILIPSWKISRMGNKYVIYNSQ